jgi:hypothetical protein
MKAQTAILSFLLASLLGSSTYLLYRYSSGSMKGNDVRPSQTPSEPLQASADQKQQQGPLSTPLPPPRPSGESNYQSALEPERTLIGMASEQLKRIELYLPNGSQIATYPVSETTKTAATASADLDNDGVIETVVIYSIAGKKNPGNAPSLYLGVLGTERDRLQMRATAPLYGTYIQNNIFKKKSVPFAIRDVIGSSHKEILVTSSIGASLGSVLQIFSFQTTSLRQIANISGDTIEVERIGDGKPSLIVARSRDGKESKTYRWNGTEFQL